jgi:hypothetical protein
VGLGAFGPPDKVGLGPPGKVGNMGLFRDTVIKNFSAPEDVFVTSRRYKFENDPRVRRERDPDDGRDLDNGRPKR